MPRTPSNMVELGQTAPAFTLPDARTGQTVASDSLEGDAGLLAMFICNHCPFVQLVRDELAAVGRDYQAKGVAVVAINSNDLTQAPDDSPELMAKEAEEFGYTFPYLFDESQDTARAFGAACTPDFFLYDAGRRLVYRGQLDDARPGNGVGVTGSDLRAALDAMLAGEPIADEQRPSIGCNIKWKANTQPA